MPEFSTPEMEQAERELDARVDYAYSRMRAAQTTLEEMEDKLAAKGDEPPSDEDVERIEKFVRGHAHTEEWQKVIERIDRGHLTWRQVVEGMATGRVDHEVAAAFDSLSKVPPASLQELIDLGVLPAHLPGEEPEQAEQPEPAETSKKVRFAGEDDEWFEDSSPLGRD